MKNSPKRKFLKMKVLICKNSWHKSYSNFKFWLFWQNLLLWPKCSIFKFCSLRVNGAYQQACLFTFLSLSIGTITVTETPTL